MPQQAAPAAPTAPTPTAPATIQIAGDGGKSITIKVPQSEQEVSALLSRREQLSDQIANVSERRAELVREMQAAPGGIPREGLEARIRLLDQRLLQMESDLASTGQQLAQSPGDLVSIARRENNQPSGDDFGEGMALGGFLTISAVLLYTVFRRWRRKRRGVLDKPEQLAAESNERLHRLEQGMDAIAIEIERISEGQRFVTRLLAEPAAQEQAVRGA